jgi:LacI family transcriptional regulator
MSKRPTIADLAKTSGFSVATVDRVLNGRLPVREETARRVHEAANAIGYHAAGLIRQRMQQNLPQYRLGFILQRPKQAFYQAFARELELAVDASSTFRGTAQVEFLESQVPSEIAERLRDVGARCKAIAMVAVDHPTVTAAVTELKEKGVPVFSLLSDFASDVRESYVGLNNRKAGRTAAWIIARTSKRPGKVVVFVGSHRFNGHEIREIGFRSYFREYAPEFELVETMVNLEDLRIAHEATLDLLQRFPDLAGFYVAGGGMEGAIAALREENMAGRLVVVCNELTPESRAALADNIVTAVIATPLARLCAELVVQMAQAIEVSGGTPGQIFLPFDLFISENI